MELLTASHGSRHAGPAQLLLPAWGSSDPGKCWSQRAVCIRTLEIEAVLLQHRISALAGEKGSRGNLGNPRRHFPRPKANSVTVEASRRRPGKRVGWVFSEERRVRRNGKNRIRLFTRAFGFLWLHFGVALLLNYLCIHYVSHLSGPFTDFLSAARLLQGGLWPLVLQVMLELSLL